MASSFDESEMKEIELDVERVDAKKVSDSKEIAFSGESTYTHNDEETMSCKNTDSNLCMVQPEDGTENIEAQFHEKQESAISHEHPKDSEKENKLFDRNVIIHSANETSEETIHRLKAGINNKTLSYNDGINGIFNMLLNGPLDLESYYTIKNPQNIDKMLEIIDICPNNIQAEIWSIFIGIVKKNFHNLESCSQTNLISKCLDRIELADHIVSDLIIQLLSVIATYSITVKELKYFLRKLRVTSSTWSPNSWKLLSVMHEMPRRYGPDVFFFFPGQAGAGISLPPFNRWPSQNGWTFSTWLRMDPLKSVNFERETPYLFYFTTSKGLGYSCYFMGNCLVLRCTKTIGKDLTKCIRHELTPRKWHHVAISFGPLRWGKNEVQCFVDGQQVEVIDGKWQVPTNEHFDRCFIGSGINDLDDETFSGQMAALYLFSHSLTVQQITSLYSIGPSYQNYFKHEAELNLPETYKKDLFDGQLNSSLLFSYCPKNCHQGLCLFQPAISTTKAHNYFVQIPHAVLKNGVKVVRTHSIISSLHSIGGIEMLLPLFAQIDVPLMSQTPKRPLNEQNICLSILSVVSSLLRTHGSIQQQFFRSQGFCVIANVLNNSRRENLSLKLLDEFIEIANFLFLSPTGLLLFKQLLDQIFLFPQLWVKAESTAQIRLYNFMANDLFSNPNFLQFVRRTQTVIKLLHTLRVYYWITLPQKSISPVYNRDEPIERSSLVHIRSCILQIVEKLIFTNASDTNDNETNRDEEFQILFDYIAIVNEDDNLYDVLTQIMNQMCIHPHIMVPAFDRKKGICVIMKLVSSENELVRIPALKILGYYLCRSTEKRKDSSINQLNLFHLLTSKLLENSRHLTMATYNVLYEILVEQICPEILFFKQDAAPFEDATFENPQLVKVIAQVIIESVECDTLIRVKKLFITDMIDMCCGQRSHINCRTILQQNVWQDWLISLSYIYPKNDEEKEISKLIRKLLSILHFHAIRYELGGWRVWVDTMAIIHSKVSHKKQSDKFSTSTLENDSSQKNEPQSLYVIPEFTWSEMHIGLHSDLFFAIESVVEDWAQSTTSLSEQLNNPENQIFVGNTVHILSHLSDMLVMACGGLLPLLAAATAPKSRIDSFDSFQQNMEVPVAADFLSRLAEIIDAFVLVSSISLSELEEEQNITNGGILRQSLRLVATMAVRNTLACRKHLNRSPYEEIDNSLLIQEFTEGAFKGKDNSKSIDTNRIIQEADINRLKGIIYRNVEENRQAQSLALSVVYFLSVLMVSKYRDVVELSDVEENFKEKTPHPGITRINGATNESDEIPIPGGTEDGVDYTNGTIDDSSNIGWEASENGQSTKDPDLTQQTNQLSRCETNATNILKGETKGNLIADNITSKVNKALELVAPFFCEIMCDFRPALQKTLLGTHGQELMSDTKVMQTFKTPHGSVIELVMLLCSQEWQTSLQKYAGHAFIELVNEGRLMTISTRDHMVRVAIQAEYLGKSMRADDASKHAIFKNETRTQMENLTSTEKLADQLILSSKRRDSLIATKILERIKHSLVSPNGAWSSDTEKTDAYRYLAPWEDDSRRRRRFIPNPYGSRHFKLSLPSKTSSEKRGDGETEKVLREIACMINTPQSPSKNDGIDINFESDAEKNEEEKITGEENNYVSEQSEQTCFSTTAKLIGPGIIVPGTISLTSIELCFDADENSPLYKNQDPNSLHFCDYLHSRWHFLEIRAIFLRRYMLQYSALELFLASRTAVMFAFDCYETAKTVVEHLPKVGVGVKYGLPQNSRVSLMLPKQLFKNSNMLQKWQRREISNFDYLMFLNTIAGRTFNDLNQYPIFPWVLRNYTSDMLDLSEAANFRDLSKPIGALSETRRQLFQKRFEEWDDEAIPPFHYGTHYSTQAFTLNWLFRIEPFATFFMDLQSGKFDNSNRLFHNLAETWEHCQNDGQDVKELVPELFYLPEMFMNLNGFDLGIRDDGTNVNSVILPPWAEGSPEKFVVMHRQALESDLVSCQLNQWIDLIFGYKQKGPEAIRATNVFYHLTYESCSINLQSIENASLRQSIEEQILNFGQTPAQLLTEPHPPRSSIMSTCPLIFQPFNDELCMLMKFISNSPIVHITANTFSQLQSPIVLSIAQNLIFALNRWKPSFSQLAATPTSSNVGAGLASNERSDSSTTISTVDLPLTVDPLLAVGNPSQPLKKRSLGDFLDQRFPITSHNFVCTVDSKFIFVCGYSDYSFRLIDTETAAVRQVIYGHEDVVTCLARSESNLYSDYYVASGSLDCTVALWHFSSQNQAIVGEFNVADELASPRSILTGHDAPISIISVSAEHGIVISGSKDGTVLIHTIQNELLRRIACQDFIENNETYAVTNILMNRDCFMAVFYGDHIATFTISGKQLKSVYKSSEKILCAALSKDGEYIVVGSEQGRFTAFRIFPFEFLHSFGQTDSSIRSIAITTNQRFILGGLDSGAITVYNIDFNKFHCEYKRRYGVT